MKTKRITRSDVVNKQFYQMPKFLFEGKLKKELTNDARVLYSLLRNRHQLSLKNNWVNDHGEVFLLFSRENMQDMLGISKNPTKKAVDLLKKFNLIQEERQGQGKANQIYLMAINVENSKKVTIRRSKESKSDGLNRPNVTPNKTEYNKTEIINNNNVVVSQKTIDEIEDKTKTRLVKEDIVAILQQTGATEEELLTMVELMTNSTNTINNPVGWLIKAIKNGYKVAKSVKFKSNNTKNSFHNFQTSNKDYTNDELLDILGVTG
jgi:NACalpha-BTF3-like transcription factor